MPKPLNERDVLERNLLALEERLLMPVTRRDSPQLRALLTDDFVEFGSSGRVFDKSAIVSALADEAAAEHIISEFKLSELADNTALVTYRLTSRQPGSAVSIHSLRTSLWRNVSGQWQLAFHQGTRSAVERDRRTFPVLETKRLILRETTASDAADLFALFSDADVMRFYDCEPLTTEAQARDLIGRFQTWFVHQTGFRWGITLKNAGPSIIGTCGLFARDHHSRAATLGYELAKSHWRRGIMRETITEILRYGFVELHLNRVCAYTVIHNVASVALLENVGFRREGVLREAQRINDRCDDLFVYALLRADWNESG